MSISNQDIRQAIKESKLFQWQVSDKLGMHDTNFSKLLRKELPEEKKQHIFSIIEELKEGES